MTDMTDTTDTASAEIPPAGSVRLARVREMLAGSGLDALVVRDPVDLRWLTAFAGVFDEERAHTVVVTCGGAHLHTDSRYATAMRDAARGTEWEIDDDASRGSAAYVARVLAESGLGTARVGIDAQTPLAEYRALSGALTGCDGASGGDGLSDVELVEVADPLTALRAVKDASEISLLRHAQEIASAAFLATVSGLSAGQSERDISWTLEREMRERGADGLAFANIVASGPNSANPHAQPSDRVLGAGDLVVFDFGALADGYRSDTTRMVSVGAPTAEQQRLYDAVRQANEEVARTVRPGASGREMHELALSVLADGGCAGLMGHSLGHGVGLDIHELPVLGPRNEEPLVAGNVATVEPGAYLPARFGARLEDCGVVTETGWESFCELSHEIYVV